MHNHAALGGTFDHLHEGHKYIIDFALENAEKLSIAIATPNLFTHKQFNETIEHFSYRKEALENYLNSKNVRDRVSLSELNDIFGSTLTDASLDSIVVTYETEPNAVRINEERKKKGLKPLTILVCPLLKGPDENIIRSTNIRSGITDRSGMAYERVFRTDVLYLPKKLRKELAKPLAKPIFDSDEITTGQEVAKILNEKSFSLSLLGILNKTLNQQIIFHTLQLSTSKQDEKILKKTTFQY
jgi:pantetheine-phosphate adenylyltransferase